MLEKIKKILNNINQTDEKTILQKQIDIAMAALEKFCGDSVSYHVTSKVDARDARKAIKQIKALNKGK